MTANNESSKRDFKAGQIYGSNHAAENNLSNYYLYLITEVSDSVVFYQGGNYEAGQFRPILHEEAVRLDKAQWFFGIFITDAHKARFDKDFATLKTRNNFAAMRRDLVAISDKIVPTELQINTLQNLINELKQQADEK